MTDLSPFEHVPPDRWIGSNETACAIRDAFPENPGHSLVITKRRIVTWWDATDRERHDVMPLVDRIKARLDSELQLDAQNVGFSAGQAGG